MNAKTILLPILLKLARVGLMTIGGFLVRKGWVAAQDSDSLVAYGVDCVPGLLLILPGIGWDLWAWLNKFEFIVKIETALHLPVTGQPAVATVAAAEEAKDTARHVEAILTAAPPAPAAPSAQS